MILSTTACSVMTAMTFISAPHFLQSSGSTSNTFRISRAQEARLGEEGSFTSFSVQEEAVCDKS